MSSTAAAPLAEADAPEPGDAADPAATATPPDPAAAPAKPERPMTKFLIWEPVEAPTDVAAHDEEDAPPRQLDLSTWRHVADILAHDRHQAVRKHYGEPGEDEVVCCALSENAWQPVRRKPKPRIAVETEPVTMPAPGKGG